MSLKFNKYPDKSFIMSADTEEKNKSIIQLKTLINKKCFHLYTHTDEDVDDIISQFCNRLNSYNPRDKNVEVLNNIIKHYSNLPRYVQCIFENIGSI